MSKKIKIKKKCCKQEIHTWGLKMINFQNGSFPHMVRRQDCLIHTFMLLFTHSWQLPAMHDILPPCGDSKEVISISVHLLHTVIFKFMEDLTTHPKQTPKTDKNSNVSLIQLYFSSRYNTKINTGLKKSSFKQRNCTKHLYIYNILYTTI